MLLVATVVLSAIWVVGMISRHTWDGKLHLVIALAVTTLIMHLMQRRRRSALGSSSPNPLHQRRDATLLNRRK